jgi:hypothetical protein
MQIPGEFMNTFNMVLIITLLILVNSCGPGQIPPPTVPIKPPTVSLDRNFYTS